jgi:hypothetical protein
MRIPNLNSKHELAASSAKIMNFLKLKDYLYFKVTRFERAKEARARAVPILFLKAS